MLKNNFYLLVGLSVENNQFFISFDKKNFFPVNKFMEVEEIFPSMLNVFSNLDSIQFKSKLKKNFESSAWAVINYSGTGEVFANQIKLSKGFKVYNRDLKLFDVFSSDLYIKIIFELRFRFVVLL